MFMNDFKTLARAAEAEMRGVFAETPLQKNAHLSAIYDADIWLKREDLSPVRSYKLRGAFNAMRKLTDQKHFVCASAGNHAQGFAVSCSTLGYKGKVFMPTTTPNQKIEQVKKFGKTNVEVVLYGENFTQAYEKALQECDKYDKTFIHPFDDKKVIAGQATLFLEIINQFKDHLDYLFIPIGGGGLISGAINVFKQLSPETKIIGIEPKGAPSMSQSINKNKLITLNRIDGFVDGVAVKGFEEVAVGFASIIMSTHRQWVVPEVTGRGIVRGRKIIIGRRGIITIDGPDSSYWLVGNI
mgnify:CR=1 FL=1